VTIKLRKMHNFFETKHIILCLELLSFRSRFILCSQQKEKSVSFCLDGNVILDVLILQILDHTAKPKIT